MYNWLISYIKYVYIHGIISHVSYNWLMNEPDSIPIDNFNRQLNEINQAMNGFKNDLNELRLRFSDYQVLLIIS